MSLRTKVVLALSVIVGLTVTVSTVAVRELRAGSDRTDQLVEVTLPETRGLGEMSTQLYALRSAQTDLTTVPSGTVASLSAVIAADVAAMRRALAEHRRRALVSGDAAPVAAFGRAWERYVAGTRSVVPALARGDATAAKATLARQLPVFLAARSRLTAIIADRARVVDRVGDEARASTHQAMSLMQDLAIVAILGGILIALGAHFSSDRDIALLSGFRGVFEDSGHGSALLDADGAIIRANRALGVILGRELEAIVGRRWDELVPGSASPSALHGVLTGEVDRLDEERPLTLRAGGTRWLAITWSIVVETTHEGVAAQLVVQVQDVTERRRAEQALGESEERFRTAFDQTSIGMAILDVDGAVLRINAALEQRILGYGAEELVGRSMLELTHPDDEESDLTLAALLRAGTETTLEQERRYRASDGSWVWCHLTLAAVHADGRIKQFVIQVQDVRQRRAVEQFLRESEGRYRSLVEHLPLVTYLDRLDPDGSTLFISPRIEELLGHPVQHWLDDPHVLASTVHPDDRERVTAEVRRANAELEDLACEFRAVAADGRTLTLLKEGVVILDEDGRALYRQGYVLDVTERRALEQQLRLSQKLESVGQMAAGIAHEINTPIQFVGDSIAFIRDAVQDLLGLGDVVHAVLAELPGAEGDALRARIAAAEEEADVAYLTERLPAAFGRTVDGIDRVSSIVRAMKAFAHPSTGLRAPVNLNEAIRTTLVVAKAEYKYVAEVELALDDALPLVPGDAGELNQVLLNLIVNAGHAIADHPSADGAPGRITITSSAADGEVRLAVADTGGGIPAEVRSRIFDPFFTTKEPGRGTGQGLAIARSIVVEHHGGAIDVETALGSGTTMTIRLPVEAAPATILTEAA